MKSSEKKTPLNECKRGDKINIYLEMKDKKALMVLGPSRS